jgi:hypothetical protein
MIASDTSLELHSLPELRNYVHERICDQHELELGAFRMSERLLTRGGNPCGLFFCVHGPRSVKLTAIWETERNTILFYGSAGERVSRTQLKTSPPLATPAWQS